MSAAGGDEGEDLKKSANDALFNKIVTSAKKKIEENEKVPPGTDSRLPMQHTLRVRRQSDRR